MSKGNYQNDWLEDLKARLNIVDVVSRYVPLEQKGRNFWGRCPFHHEKTASFAVNPDRQAYKCFGCGAGGDAIKFVEEMESQDFMGAVRILAERVGFELPEFTGGAAGEDVEKRKEKKQRLLAALKEAARFYYASLSLAKTQPARDYIEKRGIPLPIQRVFGLGASPGYDELPRFLSDKGFTYEEMAEAGLCFSKNGRWLDSLSNRLIFPIIDIYGNVAAFGGRELADSGFAKYKNTSETPVFNKSRTLYNANLVKKLKRQETVDSLIMVEGYMDAISLYQAGFKNVTASMGTSLTVQQAQQVKRLADKVYISYDGDGAGQKATLRGLDILGSEGLEVYVVELPDGLDPDDVIQSRGAPFYQELLDKALPLTEYKLKRARGEFDLKSREDRHKYALAALRVIGTLSSSVEREDYLKRLRDETGYTYESLLKDLEAVTNGREPERAPVAESQPATAEVKAARFILREMLLCRPCARYDEDFSPYWGGSAHRILYDYAKRQMKSGVPADLEELAESLGEEERAELALILESGQDELSAGAEERYFADCLTVFRQRGAEVQFDILTKELTAEPDREKRREIAAELEQIRKQLK